jgi:hypothetical protein
LSKSDEDTLETWKGNILRIIIGPVKGNGEWKICTNQKLVNLSRETNMISKIRNGSFTWLGHVERMSEHCEDGV